MGEARYDGIATWYDSWRPELTPDELAALMRLLGTGDGAVAGHHHPVVPVEDGRRLAEIDDLGEPGGELLVRLAHDSPSQVDCQPSTTHA